ncbi:MAG: hypothetical protein ACRC9V_00890, partial [Aeromonas sp.]
MGGSPTKGGPLRWLMDLVLIGPRLGIMLLDTIPFDKIPLGIMLLDTIPFDKIPLGTISFGTIPFGTMLLATAKIHQVHDYLAIDTADV